MRVELTGRHVDITPQLRRLVEHKLAKLERLLNHRALSAHAVLTQEKHRHRADITLHARGEKFLHGVGDTAAWETSIAQAVEKITQQAQRVKGKWQPRKGGAAGRSVKGVPIVGESREAASVTPAEPPSAPRRRAQARMPPILRTSRQEIRPMSVSDAAREVEKNGDGIVVFRDVETTGVSVLYRRANGDLTLVETEA
jgi:putative sigma-54 modulation protein